MLFKEHPCGLYVHDTASSEYNTSPSVFAYCLFSTVAANKRMFTHQQVEGVDLARALYHKLGCPSQRNFESYLRRNLICNTPATVDWTVCSMT